MTRYDAVVLGLGAAGSAALYQMARRGMRVLGIDRFSPPHAHGSSHGETRVTRLAIGEGTHYTPLAMRSHEIWRGLEAQTGATLLTTTGALIISSADSGSTVHGAAFFPTTVEAARRHGIAHELLDAPAIRQRFPQFAVSDSEVGYFEPGAGYLRPEECIRVQLELAEACGATVLRNTRVFKFDEASENVTVTADAGTFAADTLIVAAGPWLPGLLAPELAVHFKVYRQTLYWFDVEARYEAFAPGAFPVFIWELPQARGGLYGFPAIDGPKGGVKIATETYEETTTPDSAARAVSAADIARTHRNFVAPFFPDVGPTCVKSATCFYTVTRDFGFVVDRHPEFPRVIIASPCSGHGFKHSAALGEAIADLAAGRDSRFDISAFSLARFR